MIERGNLLVPVLNYVDYFEKPILNYWLIAACYKIFGVSTFAARLPSAVSTLLIALLIYYRSLDSIGRRAATMAALIFLTSPIVLIVGRFSLTDMPLCLFITTAILLIFSGSFKRKSADLYLGYTAVGLAVLTKGPVAILLIFGTLFSFLFLATNNVASFWKRIKLFKILPGFCLVTLLAMPWYIGIHMATSGQFTQTFFIGQNLGRALGNVNHRAPWFYYLILFWGCFFPWSILFLPALRYLVRLRRFRLNGARSRFALLCFCWSIFVFVFYSCVPTKLPTYILPMLPACALLLSIHIDDALRKNQFGELKLSAAALALVSHIVAICLPLFITGAINMKTLFSVKDFVPSKMWTIFTGSYISLELWAVALALAAIIFAQRLFSGRAWQAVVSLTSAMAVISVCLIPLIVTHFYDLRQAGFAKLVRLAKALDKPVATFEAFQPSACFELHRHVAIVKNEHELKQFLGETSGEHLLLVPENRIASFVLLQSPGKIICSTGGWSLVNLP